MSKYIYTKLKLRVGELPIATTTMGLGFEPAWGYPSDCKSVVVPLSTLLFFKLTNTFITIKCFMC